MHLSNYHPTNKFNEEKGLKALDIPCFVNMGQTEEKRQNEWSHRRNLSSSTTLRSISQLAKKIYTLNMMFFPRQRRRSHGREPKG
ncbi:unnamed protein product, partial [Bubo scandiacus]